MPTEKMDDQDVRKLSRMGGKSMGLTLPISLVRGLGWRFKQKVSVHKQGSGLLIRDWKPGRRK